MSPSHCLAQSGRQLLQLRADGPRPPASSGPLPSSWGSSAPIRPSSAQPSPGRSGVTQAPHHFRDMTEPPGHLGQVGLSQAEQACPLSPRPRPSRGRGEEGGGWAVWPNPRDLCPPRRAQRRAGLGFREDGPGSGPAQVEGRLVPPCQLLLSRGCPSPRSTCLVRPPRPLTLPRGCHLPGYAACYLFCSSCLPGREGPGGSPARDVLGTALARRAPSPHPPWTPGPGLECSAPPLPLQWSPRI